MIGARSCAAVAARGARLRQHRQPRRLGRRARVARGVGGAGRPGRQRRGGASVRQAAAGRPRRSGRVVRAREHRLRTRRSPNRRSPATRRCCPRCTRARTTGDRCWRRWPPVACSRSTTRSAWRRASGSSASSGRPSSRAPPTCRGRRASSWRGSRRTPRARRATPPSWRGSRSGSAARRRSSISAWSGRCRTSISTPRRRRRGRPPCRRGAPSSRLAAGWMSRRPRTGAAGRACCGSRSRCPRATITSCSTIPPRRASRSTAARRWRTARPRNTDRICRRCMCGCRRGATTWRSGWRPVAASRGSRSPCWVRGRQGRRRGCQCGRPLCRPAHARRRGGRRRSSSRAHAPSRRGARGTRCRRWTTTARRTPRSGATRPTKRWCWRHGFAPGRASRWARRWRARSRATTRRDR